MPNKREPVVRIAYLDWALLQPVKPTVTNVLVYLLRRANKDGECWPEQRTIASALRISTRTARRSIRLLRLCDLVKINRTNRSGQYPGGVRNVYQLQYKNTTTKQAVSLAIRMLRDHDQEDTRGRLVPPDQEDKNDRPSGHVGTRKIYREDTTCLLTPDRGEDFSGGENLKISGAGNE